MARIDTPEDPFADLAFELERFEWTSDDRLEVVGRWFGVRGRRFMRPTLHARVDGRRKRLIAVLDHKPWPADTAGAWIAAFAWPGSRDGLTSARLEVAPDLILDLPPPGVAAAGATLTPRPRPRREPRTHPAPRRSQATPAEPAPSAPAAGPAPLAATPSPPVQPDPPIAPSPAVEHDPPIAPSPAVEHDPPIAPPPTAEPDPPPVEPDPPIAPSPPAEPDPPPVEPDPPIATPLPALPADPPVPAQPELPAAVSEPATTQSPGVRAPDRAGVAADITLLALERRLVEERAERAGVEEELADAQGRLVALSSHHASAVERADEVVRLEGDLAAALVRAEAAERRAAGLERALRAAQTAHAGVKAPGGRAELAGATAPTDAEPSRASRRGSAQTKPATRTVAAVVGVVGLVVLVLLLATIV